MIYHDEYQHCSMGLSGISMNDRFQKSRHHLRWAVVFAEKRSAVNPETRFRAEANGSPPAVSRSLWTAVMTTTDLPGASVNSRFPLELVTRVATPTFRPAGLGASGS